MKGREMLIQIQNVLYYKKYALLFLFVAIHFGVHAMQPSTQQPAKEIKDVKVSFPNEQIGNDPIPVLTISTDRFPYFAAAKKFSGQQDVTASEEISFAALRILRNLDEIMREHPIINWDEGKKIAASFKLGTYNMPQEIYDQLSEVNVSVDGLQTLIHTTSFINKPDLAPLILYAYATRLVNRSIPPISTKEETTLAIQNATFDRSFDKQLAKIILDRALIKKAEYSANPIRLFPPGHNIAAGDPGPGVAIPTVWPFYLCPTAAQDACILVLTSPTEYLSLMIPKFKGPDGQYGVPIWVGQYKMPACDVSHDRERIANIAIADNASCQLNYFRALPQGRFSVNPDERIRLGDEADAQGAKLIFGKNSHTFFVKFKNEIFSYNTDVSPPAPHLIDDIKNINDPWVEKYLSEPDPMVHGCANIAYNSVSTAPYFNTSCLHALEFEEAHQRGLKNKLTRMYDKPDPDIIQCACDPEHNMHYYFSKTKAKNVVENYYNLTNVSFEPDVQMRNMINFMNKTLEMVQTKPSDIQLYPQALYIYHACIKNWTLTPEQLSAKMGLLNKLVLPELREMLVPPSMLVQASQAAGREIRSYVDYIKTINARSVGKNIGILTVGVIQGAALTVSALAVTAVGLSLFNKLPEEYKPRLAALIVARSLDSVKRLLIFIRPELAIPLSRLK
jgi:hypothetical protein